MKKNASPIWTYCTGESHIRLWQWSAIVGCGMDWREGGSVGETTNVKVMASRETELSDRKGESGARDSRRESLEILDG